MNKPRIPIYQERQNYLRLFSQQSMVKSVNALKNLPGISEIRDVVKNLRYIYPTIEKYITTNLYPKDIVELCEVPCTFFRPQSVVSEINWMLSYCTNEWEHINFFIKCKEEFEKHFLLGDFNVCQDILGDVKARLGISLWYYESMFLLYEFKGDKLGCMEFASSVLESCKDNTKNYIPTLFYKLYERSTKNLSPFKFDEDLNAQYKRNRTDLHEDYYKYVLFRLNYFNNYSQVDASLPMIFESINSLVDRYLILVKVLKSSLARDINDTSILSRCNYVYGKTGDRSLWMTLAVSGKELPSEFYNETYIQIWDSYYSGEYLKCKQLSADFLLKTPDCFDAYVLYSRSLIALEESFCNIVQRESSPLNEICSKVYRILAYDDVKNTLYSLYQLNKNLYDFDIASALDCFIKAEQNELIDCRLMSLDSHWFNPQSSSLFGSVEKAISFISKYERKEGGESLISKVCRAQLLHEPISEQNLNTLIRASIQADHLYFKEDYEAAFKEWEAIYQDSQCSISLKQEAVSRMVSSLFKGKKTQKAVNLYVRIFLSDEPSTKKVNTKEIIDYLQSNLYKDIRRTIDLVIFVGLNCGDNVDKSVILLEFCEIYGKKTPSEFIGFLSVDEYGVDKIETFFRLMNNDETLRHYLIIDNFKYRLQERKAILEYLISLKTQREDIYNQELKEVEDALLVYKLSKNLDESKIYANDAAIIAYKLGEIGGLYNRYKTLLDALLNKRKTICFIDFDKSQIFGVGEYEKESISTVSINSNGLHEVANSLYGYIKEQFLFSDYGLVAYLSTRVRHGELESQLRPVLEQRHLILSMKNKMYQNMPFWLQEYNLSSREDSALNDALRTFSTTFDNAITFLIKQRLQIFDKDGKKEGLFDYTVDEYELSCKAIEIGLKVRNEKSEKAEINKFCQLMIDWLWSKTELCLVKIRENIDTEFKTKVTDAFTILTNSIEDSIPEGYCKTKLLSSIREAQEEIYARIIKIIRWFYVSGTKAEDVDFKALSYQIFNNVSISNPTCQTDAKLEISGETFKIKAQYVPHYADILRNTLGNIFSHGYRVNNHVNMQLSIGIESDRVIFVFANAIEGGTEDNLNKNLNDKMSQGSRLFGEGGSGIAKVNKIIHFDLDCPRNEFRMYAKDGYCYTEMAVFLEKFKA